MASYIITGRNNGEYTNPYELIAEWLNNYNMVYDKLIFTNATDIYNECDDQFELSYLLKSQDKFNIEAITVAPYHHDNNI